MAKNKGKNKVFNIVSTVVFAVAVAILTYLALPLAKNFTDTVAMQEYVQSLGAIGAVVLFFLQVAQVVIAIIPGEVVEFLSGTLYGWFGGLLLDLLGIAAGQCIVFYLVRTLGRGFAERVAGSEKLKKYKFLQDEKRLKKLVFTLFFIPGTPKDTITYVVPLTKLKFKEFMLISLVARIPSVVTSTIAGDSLISGGIFTTIVIYLTVGLVSLLGVLFYSRWEKKHSEE